MSVPAFVRIDNLPGNQVGKPVKDFGNQDYNADRGRVDSHNIRIKH